MEKLQDPASLACLLTRVEHKVEQPDTTESKGQEWMGGQNREDNTGRITNTKRLLKSHKEAYYNKNLHTYIK